MTKLIIKKEPSDKRGPFSLFQWKSSQWNQENSYKKETVRDLEGAEANGEVVRKGNRGVNVIKVHYIHVCKCKIKK
jgi:hypothetical protein